MCNVSQWIFGGRFEASGTAKYAYSLYILVDISQFDATKLQRRCYWKLGGQMATDNYRSGL